MNTFLQVLAGLLPSIGVGLLFWFAMRKIVHADRDEREQMARMDAELQAQQARREAGPERPAH
jgi:hypothetical protein